MRPTVADGSSVKPVPPSQQRVLVVDDDPTVADVVVRYLARAGFDVRHTADGAEVLAAAGAGELDLVVLDIMLPGIDGLEICRRLRATSTVPVVMLTARGEPDDRIAGLEVGADDYVAKPFSPRELTLRVQSVLRRSAGGLPAPEPLALRSAHITVDTASHQAWSDATPLRLTAREFDLLAFLLAHPRQVFDRKELIERVWGWSFGDQSTVTVHVRRLREKVERDVTTPQLLVTVWGVGYRWDAPCAVLEPTLGETGMPV